MAWLDDEIAGRNWYIHTGSPEYDLANAKYGTSSARFEGDQVAGVDSLRHDPHADFVFGSGVSWTIEFWMKSTDTGSNDMRYMVFIPSNVGSAYDIYIAHHSNGDLRCKAENRFDEIQFVCDGNWHHIAFVRNWNQWMKVFVDGVERVHSTGLGKSRAMGGEYVWLGRYDFDPNPDYYTGWIDDLRISRAALYTTNFTPPTSELPVLGSTVAMMRFDTEVYQIQGDLSHDSRLIIIDESGRVVEHDQVESAGAYAVTTTDQTEKTVVAVRESDGKTLGYGRVIPTQI